jgi:hypothetical protein
LGISKTENENVKRKAHNKALEAQVAIESEKEIRKKLDDQIYISRFMRR